MRLSEIVCTLAAGPTVCFGPIPDSGPNCLGGFFRPEVAGKDRESQNKDKLRDDPSSTAHDRPEVCGIPILQADASCWEVSLDPVAVERFPYREPIDGRRIEF